MTGVATFLAGTERPKGWFFAGSLVALGGIAIIYADRMTTSANQALGRGAGARVRGPCARPTP